MSTIAQKEDRLHIRVSDRQKRLLVEAARARHLSTSQFVVQASMDAAEKVLADGTTITFTSEQWEIFGRRLDESPRNIPALKKLFDEPELF